MSFCPMKYDSILRKFTVFFLLTTALSDCGEHFPSMNGEYEWFILSVELLAPVSPQQRVNINNINQISTPQHQRDIFAWSFSIFSPIRAQAALHWVRDKVNINNLLSLSLSLSNISLLLLRASSWTFHSEKERQVRMLSRENEIWSDGKIYNFQCCQTAVKVSLWTIVLNYSFTASESWIVRTLLFNANCYKKCFCLCERG